jgi:Tfp pilus assembly protein PilX
VRRLKLNGEAGSAVVTSIMVMAMIVTLGLASYAYVDTQSKMSGNERNRESTFNYGEGVLNSEAFVASSNWPGSSATSALPDCSFNGTSVSSSSGDVTKCPTAASLSAAFTSADYARGVTWTAKVRDNVGTTACKSGTGGNTCGYYYSDSAVNQASVARYDANGDGMLWIRSRTTVGTSSRTQVALVQVQKQSLNMPHSVLTANSVTSNYSPKLKVFPGGSSVMLRCPSAQAGNPQGCVNTKRPDQIPAGSLKATGGSPALKAADLELLRQRAKSEGKWYASCPSSPPGPLVFIESGFCGQSSLPPTSAANPGLYVLVDGTLNIGGSGDYWGLIYLVNKSGHTGNVFDSNGNHKWNGAINIDGPGNANLGTSSNTSLNFDDNVFNGLFGYANAGIVRPSYREIQSSNP